MLIIQIAIAIVLAVLILRFLPGIVGVAFALIVAAIAISAVYGLWLGLLVAWSNDAVIPFLVLGLFAWAAWVLVTAITKKYSCLTSDDVLFAGFMSLIAAFLLLFWLPDDVSITRSWKSIVMFVPSLLCWIPLGLLIRRVRKKNKMSHN